MKKIFLLLKLVIFFCIVIVPGVAFTQMQGEYSEPYTLGEVVVSAEKKVVESVGTVREITSEDIQNKDARTLDEALQLLPGVIIRTGADGVPRVDLRGFRSRHVILLLDGIPINSTDDGQFDPSIIPTENIERIKVSYGDHSVLYGDGGLGGVINIITKRQKKGINGMVSGEAGGKGDSYLGRFNISGGKGIADFFLSGSMYDRNGFPLSDDFKPTDIEDGDVRNNSDKRRNNLFANLNVSPNDRLTFGGVVSYSHGEFGKPPSTIDDPTDLFADKPKFERIDNFEGWSGQLSVGYDIPGPLGVRAWIFINQLREEDNQYDDGNYNSMDDPTVKGTFHQMSTTRIKGAALQTSYDLQAFGLLTLGLNARKEELDLDGRIRDVPSGGGGGGGGGGTTYAVRDFKDDRDIEVYSVALEYEVTPFKNFGLVLGYGHNWQEKDDGGNDNSDGGSDNEGSYLVGAYYDITQNTRIKASAAKQIRFPTILQLYDESGGNPDLTTEKSYNYELGLEQKLPLKSLVTLTGFLIDVKNYIEKIDDVNQNNDKYRFQGFELTGETRFVRNLLLRAGYTYLDTKDRSPDTEKDELQYRPRHKLTFESKYYFPFGLSPYMNIIYVADQVFYTKKTPFQKRSLNDYFLVNLRLDQALLKNKVNLYVGVDNLFDTDYETSYGFPQAGRFIYGGVQVNI
jgi:vitamin B12 transporter